MIIKLPNDVTEDDLLRYERYFRQHEIPFIFDKASQPIQLVVHLLEHQLDAFKQEFSFDCVEKIKGPGLLTSREGHPNDTIIQTKHHMIGGTNLTIMAGPCAVESREQIFEAAEIAKKGGAHVLRGGAFKPRTSPYTFQGLGEQGLIWMREAADYYDLAMITEVMDEKNLQLVEHYTDILQIGARNMQNYRLLEAVGRSSKPVALKRGMASTIEEWLNAGEYIVSRGNHQLLFVERGIRTFEPWTRNTFDINAVAMMKQLTHFPIIADPSHGIGKSEYVTSVAKASVVAGAHGVIVEVHPEPEKALSDGRQSLDEKAYLNMSHQIKQLHALNQTLEM